MLTLSLAKRKRKSEPSSTAQCCSTVWSTSAARIRRCSERLGCDVQMTAARFSGFLPLQLPLLNSGNDSGNPPFFWSDFGSLRLPPHCRCHLSFIRLPLLEVVGLEHAAVPEPAVVPVYGQVLQSVHVTLRVTRTRGRP